MSDNARRDEELATQRRASILAMNYADTSQTAVKQLFKDILTTAEMYQLKVVPLYADAHTISFGITNNTSQQTMAGLRQRFLDQQINFNLISDSGYREYMKLYDPPKEVVYQDISLNTAGTSNLVQTVSSTLGQVRADDILAYLVQQAHQLNASDIHLETQRDETRVRFRIDGVLHPIAKLSKDKYRVLIGAIASAGNISTAAESAQQGHIASKARMADGKDVDVNVRLETTPTINGMDVVMRLFNMNQAMYSLDRLGLSKEERSSVDGIISRPSGLVLVVGPTGSGKTTTIYSMLNSLNSEERKIITIEDPVEYQFAGITQISVGTKTGQETSFADMLRGVLRLDPDIVMIGEIRDADTAKTALQASLTGHLVLSTFHAASASAALTRIIDVINGNLLFLSSIRLVMAQRLVRRLDDASKQPYTPDEATLKRISEIIKTLPEGTTKPDVSGVKLYKPGKSSSNPFGYSGQVAIREQLSIDEKMKTLLSRVDKLPSTSEIEATAISGGMKTMLQDGVLKAMQGITTLDEIFRVVD